MKQLFFIIYNLTLNFDYFGIRNLLIPIKMQKVQKLNGLQFYRTCIVDLLNKDPN